MAQHFGSIAVDIAKLRDYCLSETHPRGRHKARVFRSSLGLTADDSEWLRQALLDAIGRKQDDLHRGESDEYGDRYFLDFELTVPAGTANIRSTWIVLTGEDVQKLASC